jgi:hypothetical protein
MKLFWQMLFGSIIASFILSTLLFREFGREIWLGMAGPLAAALVSWVLIIKQHGKAPEGLTQLLIKSFACKMIFIAAYVAILIKMRVAAPVPFAVSFTCYFIFLHVMEAIGLHRLQASGFSAPGDVVKEQSGNGLDK